MVSRSSRSRSDQRRSIEAAPTRCSLPRPGQWATGMRGCKTAQACQVTKAASVSPWMRRSSRFNSLPDALRGRVSLKMIRLGTL